MQRRSVLQAALAGVAATTLGMLTPRQARAATAAKVVVVGGGFGGATAARYLRTWSHGAVDVTLIEPDEAFVSCPLSNLVVAGYRQMADITLPYDTLVSRHGVKHVRDTVTAIDPAARTVRVAGGGTLPYDRLILSPGVEMQSSAIPGLARPGGDQIVHAWKAGPQTDVLRRQLAAMPDGGTFAITIPLAPYRCPPGPYERACLVADYLKQHKPRSKVLVLDANPDITSKGALFRKVWETRYKGMIEYRPQFETVDVDPATRTIRFDVQDDERADVINLLPPQRAGAIAVASGLATANGRWCEVDFLTMASTVAPDIHVLGDAVQIAPLMPKSGTMANQHGKVAAAAILRLLAGQDPDPEPVYTNTCYSFTSSNEAIHVASVHRYDAGEKTMLTVPGSGGLSVAPSRREGEYGLAWAHSIWADMLGA
ncbi:sulfide dehydrogenase [flavocytochrome c] flavoprotein chain [Cupriavidus metallidurans]|jgi:NADPH-dependent 2,4-dienoyl-CoA reductase/sulfur reductase-like enzyme|uniref:Probable sulfide dehydrogenase flavocytochrome c oxidoreductase protein n=1 Tax=Cupriavidus metallidurans (strain ATCC 43123 / DSM 2839 / NBRC 102507 / CH34) TaxID=266264 RepID=Q1LHS8_CUPMC|nr:NAD(P)/FAD-dependent oxidoreductase [Cupriavidus metallidurans]ABF10298.1 Probable sulfide dehydrogenase flavocytochrome c oxidoreductase protein [Cupriavidus metallidurans CH34]KWW33677.1 Sulfide dehydrogenase [flavocytochrome c] flavoprotein chain [Cupriavidus metallidurans]MDE4919754.1 NAD(P)/FAD-dependent oxidoreductase [Cupriavidus metallidurans]QGS28929.1 flavocytochrome C [Cupriavidus metallidurans]